MKNLFKLTPAVFTLTHRYVALAILESFLNEEGYGLAGGQSLDDLNSEQVSALFDHYVRDINLEACCVKLF